MKLLALRDELAQQLVLAMKTIRRCSLKKAWGYELKASMMPQRKIIIIRSELTHEQEIATTHTSPTLEEINKLRLEIRQLRKNLKRHPSHNKPN